MTTQQIKVQRVSLLVLVAAVYLAGAIAVFAQRRPDYSHLRHTISELGEFGGADSGLVSFGVFLPVGIALAVAAVTIVRLRPGGRAAAALAGCVATGYLVAAFFPCDPGSPLSGTPRQAIHNWGGAVEYFGGAIALGFLARVHIRFRWFFATSGAVVLAVAFALSVPDLAGVRGLLQRIAETALFGSVVLATLPSRPPTGR